MNHPTPTRAWREPWMWLVLGLPATVVVAGFVTLFIAASDPQPLQQEPHSKVGFTVNRVDSPNPPAD